MHRLNDADRVFAPFQNARGLLVAVSGGPDSLALLHLIAGWAVQPGRPPVAVATVDHGLRAGAQDEVALVATAAASLGLPHHALAWEGHKPSARLQERARAARYALLAACAKHIGADTILTAHHADDQAETVLFRLLRGSGPAGLAAMAPVSPRDGLTIGRPLLGWRKADCVVLCDAVGQRFVDDPSNADPRFARARLRRLAPLLAAEGLDGAALTRLARRAQRAEAALASQAEAVAGRACLAAPAGQLGFAAAVLAREADEIVLRVVDAAIARLTGRRPRLDRLEAAVERLVAAWRAGLPFTATLGGTALRLRADRLVVSLEAPRRSASRAGAAVGETAPALREG